MASLLGLHLPNRHLETNELARIRAVGCNAYIVFVPFLGDWPYWLTVCQQIRTVQPTAQIHLRLEKRGDLGNPSDEANQAATIVNHFAGFIDTWTWRNEPNIECPLSVTPSAWQTWLTTFLANADLLATPPVAAPPVSPGARDATLFMQATANAARAAGVKFWHVHFYGNPDEAQSDMQRHRAVFADTLVGTEYNFGAGRPYDLNRYVSEMPEVCRRAAALRIQTVGVFIWQWFTPPWLPTGVNIRDTVVEPGMTAMQKSYPEPTQPPPGGTTVTEAEFERQCADIWKRAGVVYNPGGAFAKYWKASWRNLMYLGSPEEQEHKSENGVYYLQAFAGAYLWSPVSNPADVHEGHPPFS